MPTLNFDASSKFAGAAASPTTLSHTCTGSNRGLLVGLWISGSATISAITYAGTAMTQVSVSVSGTERYYVYRLENPASGANNISVTPSSTSSVGLVIMGQSWTGVSQTRMVGDVYSDLSAIGSTTSITSSVYPSSQPTVGFWFAREFNGRTITAGSNTVYVDQETVQAGIISAYSVESTSTSTYSMTLNASSATTGFIKGTWGFLMPVSAVYANPNTGSGSTTMDGWMPNGYATTWAGVRSTVQGDGVGNTWQVSNTALAVRALKNASGYYCQRIGLTFDTSVLGAGVTITSATLSVFGQSSGFVNNDSTSLELVSFNPANKATFVDSDWTTVGSTTLATGINFASLSQSAYNDFVLNSSVLANINKTGVSSFMFITGLDLNNVAPGATTHDNIFNINASDFGSNKPKLVVNYTTASGNSRFFVFM